MHKFLFNYIDPGSGFVFGQNSSLFLGALAGVFGSLVFLIKHRFNSWKRLFGACILLIILISSGVLIMKAISAGNKRKVVVLGIDAMSADITEELMRQGRLTNLASLKSKGSYARLATTNPSESIVAWSSFSTGQDPGSHGIFDFIMRNPAEYSPYLALNEINNNSDGGGVVITNRKNGENFWNILSRNKVPSYIYFCPNTFPPERVMGKMFSGMGVPDISGTMGKFSFYTTRPLSPEDRESRGRIIQVSVDKGSFEDHLYGPMVASNGSPVETHIPLKAVLRPAENKVIVIIQGKRVELKKGDWSAWVKVSFDIGMFRKAHGMLRMYLKSLAPDFELYVSPVNFDPERPLFRISFPRGASRELAKENGLFYTQGMPYDTWALTEGRIDERAFLELVDEISGEHEKICFNELRKHKSGLFFYYFEALDVISHMFWRYRDREHPLYENDARYKDTVALYYEKADRMVGKILKALDKDTVLIILSDHGFSSFRRAVNLNRWLLEQGFLALKPGVEESAGFLENIDWSKTKAYALGFGGIYLNRIAREYYGIVAETEVKALKNELKEKLRSFIDPKTGKNAVYAVYLQEEIFQGQASGDAPDLFVGFNEGYRASWQTALGAVPRTLIDDNKRKWSGDHLVDPHFVPGVIFSNKKLGLTEPTIIDLSPTILKLYGIQFPRNIPGKPLLNIDEEE
jgi:predicted AlkP superfamily phosphohydrolase/phosphomutase